MSTDQVQLLISLVTEMRTDMKEMGRQLDDVKTEVSAVKTDVAVQGDRIESLMKDRESFKEPILTILKSLGLALGAVAAWLAYKLGFSSPQ